MAAKKICAKPGMVMLPDELVIEILTQLSGKDVGRCKCVSKSWRSIIMSPHFSDTYRNHNRCLMLFRLDTMTDLSSNYKKRLFRFYYSPLRGKIMDDDNEEFVPLHQMPSRKRNTFSHLVSGLICVARYTKRSDVDPRLTIHNVCTGESMTIPKLVSYNDTRSLFELGYDPSSRTYKLLRFIFSLDIRLHGYDHQLMQVDIMTLRSSTSGSEWRKLNNDTAGINPLLHAYTTFSEESRRLFSGDGVLCWTSYLHLCPLNDEACIILFDLNREIFRFVKISTNLQNCYVYEITPRAQFNEQYQLALSLWLFDYVDECLYFVKMEDGENEIWSEREKLSILKEFGHQLCFKTGIVNGSDGGNSGITLVNTKLREVYCTNNMDERLWVGKFQAIPFYDCSKSLYSHSCWLSYLLDSTHLYHSLDEVLSGKF